MTFFFILKLRFKLFLCVTSLFVGWHLTMYKTILKLYLIDWIVGNSVVRQSYIVIYSSLELFYLNIWHFNLSFINYVYKQIDMIVVCFPISVIVFVGYLIYGARTPLITFTLYCECGIICICSNWSGKDSMVEVFIDLESR